MKQMPEKNQTSLQKLLPGAVVGLLLLFFITGVGLGGFWVLHVESIKPAYEPDPAAVEQPQTPEEAVKLLQDCLALAVNEQAKLKITRACNISDISFPNADPLIGTLAKQRIPLIEGAYNGMFPEHAYDFFGTDAEQTLESAKNETDFSIFLFTPADVAKISTEYIHYRCDTCGALYDEMHEFCESCHDDEIKKKDEYRITVRLQEDSPIVSEIYSFPGAQDITALIRQNSADFYLTDDVQVQISQPEASFTVGRTDGRLKDARIEAKKTITGTLTFLAPYAQYGGCPFSCLLTDSLVYDVTWHGVSLPDSDDLKAGKNITVAPNKTVKIKASFLCEDDAGVQELIWRTSDESLCSVTQDGYVKTGKQKGRAIVTVSYTYGDKTYSDQAEIVIRNPVKLLILNRYSLRLKTGETYRLKTAAYPFGAMDQPVAWSSENRSVASVDANGNVTAIAPGTTIISAVSDDGYTKVSCQVEVRA